MSVTMMMPMSVMCHTCGEFIYKGTKFVMRKENVIGETYLGIQIFRFAWRCPKCSSELSFVTDPKNHDYLAEKGCKRTYEPWKAREQEAARLAAAREETEAGNAMKALENRTLDSKREMDILAALDEARALNSEKHKLDLDQLIARHAASADTADAERAAAAREVEREAEDREATNASLDDGARRSFLDADVVFDYHFGKAAPRYLVSDELERSLESLVSLRADAREYRIVHVVRNPVDVIVSGLTYHRRTPLDEKWLTSVREELRGRTYADVLANATPGEAVAAEMLFSDDELRMLVLTYIECDRDDWCLNIRLEELETNFDFWIGRALKFLKLPSKDIGAMVRAAAVHDVGRWSEDELQKNEHFTKREDRAPYYDAIRHDAEILSTLGRLQIAMNYTSSTGNDALTV